MKLRDYQQDCVTAVFKEWETVQSTIVVLYTGAGKTVVFSHIIKLLQPKRVLVIAHREELINQAHQKILAVSGLDLAIEMASSTAETNLFERAPGVIATVQTLNSGRERKRMHKFKPTDFDVIIIDECHRGTAASYVSILDYFKQNPNLKILGVTATPIRADGIGMHNIFQSTAFDEDIREGISKGWLCNVTQQFVPVHGLDYSHIKTVGGDFNQTQLKAVMEAEENVAGVCHPALEVIYGLAPKTLEKIPVPEWGAYIASLGKVPRRTIVFTVSVAQAEACCNIFNRVVKDIADWICGKTDRFERKKKLKRFADGRTAIMVNVGVLCLDSQTEILTSDGWIGMNEMTYHHKVANWDNGRVFFEEPKHIVRRDRLPGEAMICLDTKNRSIRVTQDHRMLFKGYGEFYDTKEWQIVHAADLVGKKGRLPISGIASPFPLLPEQEKQPKSSFKRAVAYNSYTLRKTHGMSDAESKLEASRRIKRIRALRYTTPGELTLEDCEFIGFWLGDGGKTNLSKGGVEYTLCQWAICTNIINRVDYLIKSCGFDSIKRMVKGNGESGAWVTQWSLPRGTGYGCQERNGLFRLEPYLTKTPNQLLWAFDEKQFDAFIRGYWMADGCDHGNRISPPTNCIRICGAREKLLSHIQAIACVRGYRASLRVRPNGKDRVLWFLSMTKKSEHIMTKYTMQKETDWKAEKVWCVTSTTGNIITRRKGAVTITGNTEGYDNPAVEVIIQARPTKSESLYRQMIGRSTRTLPGIVDALQNATPDERKAAIAASAKPFCRVIDLVGNTGSHTLVSCMDVLAGKLSPEARKRAVKKAQESGKPIKVMEALDRAETDLRVEKEKERKAQEEARKAKLVAKAKFSVHEVDAFGFAAASRTAKSVKWKEPATEKQINFLSRFCKEVKNPQNLTKGQARGIIAKKTAEWESKGKP